MNRILLGVIAVLMLLVVSGGWYLKHTITKNSQLSSQLKTANEDLKDANKTINQLKQVADASDKVVDTNVVDKGKSTDVVAQINKRVDKTNEEFKQNKVDVSSALSSFNLSMWSTYCEATENSGACSAKRPN